MTFFEAIQELKKGEVAEKIMRRPNFREGLGVIRIYRQTIQFYHYDKKDTTLDYVFTIDDIEADDWEAANENVQHE